MIAVRLLTHIIFQILIIAGIVLASLGFKALKNHKRLAGIDFEDVVFGDVN